MVDMACSQCPTCKCNHCAYQAIKYASFKTFHETYASHVLECRTWPSGARGRSLRCCGAARALLGARRMCSPATGPQVGLATQVPVMYMSMNDRMCL